MDLNYDYGDVVHTHQHIHTKPDSHKQVVEHALKEWCHHIFGDDAEEKCDELNEIAFHDIDDGSRNDMKVSDIFNSLMKLQRLSGRYKTLNGFENKYIDIIILGTKLKYTEVTTPRGSGKEATEELYIKREDNNFYVGTYSVEIMEDGIKFEDKIYNKTNLIPDTDDLANDFYKLKYDTDAIKELKQSLRNLNIKKLQEEMEVVKKNIESKEKELKHMKDVKVDEVSAKRQLENLEKIEQDRIRELILLVILFIIAVCFGIYCVYNFFVLDL